MKKLLLLKSLLLLCALIVGTSAWADPVSTLSFTSACGGSGTAKLDDSDATSGTVTWTVTSDANESSFDDNRGIHYGTNNATVTYIQLSTTSFTSGTISKIEVEASGANNPSLSVTVGGNAFGTTATNLTNSNEKYTFTGSASAGTIVVRLAKSAAAKKALYIKSVAVTYTTQQKTANGLSWSAESKDVTYSVEPYGLPTLTNPHSLAITYNSSDKSVATIDSEGNVTIKNKTGNTTISASTEGDATYAAGTVSYTLNVTQKVIIEDGVFNFGFGPSDGGDYGSGMSQVGSGTIIENESETWTAGNVTLVVANRYAWNTDGKFVIYKKAGGANAAGSITLSCPAGKAITQIEFTGPYTGTGALSNMAANIGNYTVTSTSAIWTGAAQSISFSASNSTYINTITVTYGSTVPVTIASSGYSTLGTTCGLDFANASPAGLEAYVVPSITASAVSLSDIDEAPASTGVILKGTPDGTYTIPVKTTASFDGTNKLKTAVTATTLADGSFYIMKGGKFCLVTNTENDAARTVPAGKAYLLATDVPSEARELTFVFDDVTAIETVKSEKTEGQYFNLAGQRVAQPTKGLYIVNGKKVIIK